LRESYLVFVENGIHIIIGKKRIYQRHCAKTWRLDIFRLCIHKKILCNSLRKNIAFRILYIVKRIFLCCTWLSTKEFQAKFYLWTYVFLQTLMKRMAKQLGRADMAECAAVNSYLCACAKSYSVEFKPECMNSSKNLYFRFHLMCLCEIKLKFLLLLKNADKRLCKFSLICW